MCFLSTFDTLSKVALTKMAVRYSKRQMSTILREKTGNSPRNNSTEILTLTHPTMVSHSLFPSAGIYPLLLYWSTARSLSYLWLISKVYFTLFFCVFRRILMWELDYLFCSQCFKKRRGREGFYCCGSMTLIKVTSQLLLCFSRTRNQEAVPLELRLLLQLS